MDDLLKELERLMRDASSLSEKIKHVARSDKQLKELIATLSASSSMQDVCVGIKCHHQIFLFCEKYHSLLCDDNQRAVVGNVFQNTYASLKIAIGVIDESNYFEASFQPLVDCVLVLLHLDMMAATTICKSIKLLRGKCERSDRPSMVYLTRICGVTRELLQLIKDSNVTIDANQMKIVKYFLGFLLQLISEAKHCLDEDAVEKIYKLLLCLQSFQVVLHERNGEAMSTICEAAMKVFVNEMNFTGPKLKELNESLSASAESLLLLSTILRNSSVFHLDFLEIFFDELDQTSALIFEGKCLVYNDNITVGLYEHLLFNISIYMAANTDETFAKTKQFLFETLRTSSSNIAVVFFSDLISFLSRWCSKNLHYQYIIELGKMLLNNKESCNLPFITILFQRLSTLVEDHSQLNTILISSFPIGASTLLIWSYYPLERFNLPSNVVTNIVAIATTIIGRNPSDGNTEENIVSALRVIANFSRHATEQMSADQRETIVNEVTQFWKCFSDVQEDIEMEEEVMLGMLEITEIVFSQMEPGNMVQVLETLSEILLCSNSQLFRVAMTRFLSSIKTLEFPFDVLTPCLSAVCAIFNHVVGHVDWMTSYCGQVALKDFAEMTVYPEHLKRFLPQPKREEFANFLKQIVTEISPLKFTAVYSRLFKHDSAVSAVKEEDEEDKIYKALKSQLTVVKREVDVLKGLASKSRDLPLWFLDEEREVMATLAKITKPNEV